jgi:uncharacterized Fe-S cluster-containing radical SAM superfamily protein
LEDVAFNTLEGGVRLLELVKEGSRRRWERWRW